MISIVIPWRDRQELAGALPSITAEAGSCNGEVIVVNFGGSSDALRQQIESAKVGVKVLTLARAPFFNKAAANNLGFRYASHDCVFFCDCDIIVSPGSVTSLAAELSDCDGHFATFAGVRESEVNSRGANFVTCFGYELLIRTANDREVKIIDNEEDAIAGTRQAPGLLMVKREHFLRINGYNSRLHGWGWEDQDMICRLTLGAGLRRILKGTATHISHDDTARMQAYPGQDRWESRDRMFRKALANYDRANFDGTFAEDVSGSQDGYYNDAALRFDDYWNGIAC